MSTNKEPCGVTCFLALFFFSFFFARQHSEHHLPLICTAVIMIVRYDTMRRVLCVFLFVFFCFGLSCQPRMQPCCSLSLPPAPPPLVSSSSVHTQEAQYERHMDVAPCCYFFSCQHPPSLPSQVFWSSGGDSPRTPPKNMLPFLMNDST